MQTLFDPKFLMLGFKVLQRLTMLVDVSRAKTVGAGCMICLETDDVEAAIEKAIAAGATNQCATTDGDSACCGGRVAKLKDPYGFVWLICSPAVKPVDVAA